MPVGLDEPLRRTSGSEPFGRDKAIGRANRSAHPRLKHYIPPNLARPPSLDSRTHAGQAADRSVRTGRRGVGHCAGRIDLQSPVRDPRVCHAGHCGTQACWPEHSPARRIVYYFQACHATWAMTAGSGLYLPKTRNIAQLSFEEEGRIVQFNYRRPAARLAVVAGLRRFAAE